jgi:phosphatidylethanolamine-binding protein (PEBP) family uncharacterized protein
MHLEEEDLQMPLTLSSSAFSHQGNIPARYTCEGEDISPPLLWSDVPEGTQSFISSWRIPMRPIRARHV